ncbi:hypothetical protein VE03_06064 [Pseudogymnoascus sp. 23342-1-I1]|nr:hypothetical protein VE03_06064 [Pseudogymnoascus sp. 23342-1-I1]
MTGHHRVDEKRFLDERGSSAPLCPNGYNPATLFEKPVRERIIDCYFWKDQCFALNEADIVSRVVEHVHFIAGTYGDSQRPSPFLCLAFKLLQLGPGDDVLKEYLGYGGERFKYLRALACFYVRLTRPAEQVYETLEPFLEDARKLRRRGRQGVSLTFVDQFVDELLTKERVCATSLWKMPTREQLEDSEKLEPRVSALGDIEALLEEEEEDVVMLEGQNGGAESDVEEGSEGGINSPGEEFGREMSNDSDGRRRTSREEDERSRKDD